MKRLAQLLLLLAFFGCDKAQEKATEIGTKGQVKVSGDKVTVKTEDGEAVIQGDKRVMRVRTKGGETVVQGDEQSTQIKTKDGTFNFGKGEIPRGFPLPVYKGAQVGQTGHLRPPGEGEVYQLSATVKAPVAEVAAFYKKALEDKKLKLNPTELKTGDVEMARYEARSDKVEAAVSISKNKDEADTIIAIVWTNKP
ncbi:MAG: hypothetical protein JXQ73_25380 [Phycisphaerae bacterium]|nr:hypothetical protein [Phycisphaerae bacterium]